MYFITFPAFVTFNKVLYVISIYVSKVGDSRYVHIDNNNTIIIITTTTTKIIIIHVFAIDMFYKCLGNVVLIQLCP